jgi:hypothetical protein
MIDTLLLQQDLTDQERLLYMGEFQAQRKDSTTAEFESAFESTTSHSESNTNLIQDNSKRKHHAIQRPFQTRSGHRQV